ncbi:Extracellular ligand-binding receptor [Denitrovibrio acetiphilus DSM 12809]|uniref:Extracellular ligand-binding receptor n=1 Tax=Denitrovibrio acetiphilus (strain DSM 12809 / NBRC 114555 / N2460) TaxID=522772 RepID=D4H497_DENA2|nr:ABC transporter substrate-binding protein [Denitrovibrio acetiphilus]ADD69226.1 Extracellular ligand-binding receptor [Denitrovibrio acetiphilus DSM 12809]
MKKVLIITLMLCLSATAFAEIRLGALFAVTGPTSFLGNPEKLTVEMLVDQINDAGGINGEKIKLFVYDTQGREDRAISYFKRLATKDRVLAVLGPSRTGCALAIKNLAIRYKVPFIACAASATIVEPANAFIYKTPQSDIHVAEKLFDHLKSKGKTNVALISAQSGYGATGRDAVLQNAERFGINIIADEKFMDTDKEMTAQLSKIKDKNVDAVICWAAGAAPAIVARNAKALGMNNIYMTQGIASRKFIELAGDAAEGVKLTAGRLIVADKLDDTDRFKTMLMKYKTDYESKFGGSVSVFGGHAYDAFGLFAAAVAKSGKDPVKLANELQQIKGFMGTAGEFNMSNSDHTGLSKDSFIIAEIKNGEFVPAE